MKLKQLGEDIAHTYFWVYVFFAIIGLISLMSTWIVDYGPLP
jgi:hypothetical protein